MELFDLARYACLLIMIGTTFYIYQTVSGPEYQTAIACKAYKPLIEIVRSCRSLYVDCLDNAPFAFNYSGPTWKELYIQNYVNASTYNHSEFYEDNETKAKALIDEVFNRSVRA